nr:MAG TPA: hypothetical protein [Caudoviricetes sp.]
MLYLQLLLIGKQFLRTFSALIKKNRGELSHRHIKNDRRLLDFSPIVMRSIRFEEVIATLSRERQGRNLFASN